MAYFILDRPGFGEKLGEALGTGLGSGLQSLAQQKLRAMQYGPGLRALLPEFSEEQVGALANLDPILLKEYIKQQGKLRSDASFNDALNYLESGPQPKGSELESLFASPPSPELSQKEVQQLLEEAPLYKAGLSPEKVLGKKAITPERLTEATPALKRELAEESVPKSQRELLADYLQKKGASLSTEQRERIEKILAAREKEQAKAFKETKEERKDILTKARQARMDLRDLERLEELEKEGKLDTPGYVEFLQRSGLDIPALMNEGSEEFQKIQQTFLRNAKDYFGGRISNYEIEQFLKTIPSLSQSPEGRKRVIANLKYIKRAELAYKDAYKEVLAKHKGVPPLDLLEEIDDRIDPKLEQLSKRFKEDLRKPVPKGQNKFITALQAAAGSVAGAPGKVLDKLSHVIMT